MRGLIARGRHRRVAPRTLSTRGLVVWAAVFTGWRWVASVVLIGLGVPLLQAAQNVPIASLTSGQRWWFMGLSAGSVMVTLGMGYVIFRVEIVAAGLSKVLSDQVAASVNRASSPRIPGLD